MILTFEINSEGWLDGVMRILSPNCDERPTGQIISLLVVHGISLPSGEFGGPGIEALFTNNMDISMHPEFKELAGLQVSAHLLIRRDGQIIQFVPFTKRAWHAGKSNFGGRACCNDFSIGVELEGVDDRPYDDRQYSILVEVIKALQKSYPEILTDRIVGHCDIAPGRKTDPGEAFDWLRLKSNI
ncbi:MAG: 1,6-anhydro-N-acetylmuramyl-L-alanine amidase AmpD [Gammaproteobacteria bacterium]|nr:1,6-anhydro-N-acetylmuramyl-L-alanine amidase AmpD [Gammaproteobacteria bacterium]